MKINRTFAFLFCLLLSPIVFASEKGQPIMAPLKIFKVENDQPTEKIVTVTSVKHVPKSKIYVVRGRLCYENVEGVAYLEMWNILPDGSRYFSRTLGDFGTMKKISGTSGWREFELPFNLMDAKPESVTLEINVFMPGKGKIQLSGLTVSDLQTSAASEWFNGRTGGVVGGVLGCLGGLYGALVGCLCGFLVPRGRGKRWVMGLVLLGTVMGAVSLLFGLSALLIGQPYHVWYPFLLTGGIIVCLFPFLFVTINKEYAKVELRRMQALDL